MPDIQRVFYIAVLSLLLALGNSHADQTLNTIELLHDTITAGEAFEVAGEPVIARGLVSLFYQNRDFKPAWTDLAYAATITDYLGQSGAEGLFPADYHHRVLVTLLERLGDRRPGDSELEAQFDILLTDGILLYASHLINGKINPSHYETTWNYDDVELLPEKVIDALNRHAEERTVVQALDGLGPELNVYHLMKNQLAFFSRLADEHPFNPIPLPKTMRRGDEHQSLVDMRGRLALLGFQVADLSSHQFDHDLELAVRDFQKQYHLDVDGAVGPATLRELNVPFSGRVDQIRINMERTRWVADDLSPMVLVVNVAGFKLWVARDDRLIWSTDVMTGTIRTKTPVFKARMTYLVLNPTWTAPRSIAREMLPKLKRDPTYLATNNYRLIDRQGQSVDPASLDWSTLTKRNFPYTLVQMPGENNALGQVKFMFPNKHAIYLHDTPSKHLFEKTQRAFSHGCIRVKDPLVLAEMLLNDPQSWSREQIDQVIGGGVLKNVKLKNPVEVLIMYWTVQPGEDGDLVFLADVYDRDPTLIKALKKSIF